MRSHHDNPRPWRAFGLIVLGAATFLMTGAMLLVILRSEQTRSRSLSAGLAVVVIREAA
jgi:hypothetical protein